MKIYHNILSEFDREISTIEGKETDILAASEKGIRLSKTFLAKLKKRVVQEGFDDVQKEIRFFKYIKPQVLGKFIYFVRLFEMETKRPKGSFKNQRKYLNEHLLQLQSYFVENQEFYLYYRRQDTLLDEYFFLRGKTSLRLHRDTFHFFIDEDFCTSHDSSVATIIGYELLISRLKEQLMQMEIKKYPATETRSRFAPNKFTWTGNKVDLIELIYALHSSGAINGGAADIKEIADLLEDVMGIDLGDYYRTFLEIRSRKINQTKFLDRMKQALERRMIEADENLL